MKIYRNGTTLLDIPTPNDSIVDNVLMGEHSVSFTFELAEKIDFEKGDYIETSERFWLSKKYIPTINKATRGYQYELMFYDFTKRYEDFLLKSQGQYKFTPTTTGDRFLQLVIDNITQSLGGTIIIGDFPIDIKEIAFENNDIFSAMNLIAESYETEIWFSEVGGVKELNLSKCEFGSYIELTDDIELDSITQSESTERLITRLYAFGLDRNMPLGQTLQLPPIDAYAGLPQDQIIEGVVVFDIYPRQENKITDVIESTVGGRTIYTIKGETDKFTPVPEDRFEGKPLKIAFNKSTYLAGLEYDLEFRDNGFEIIHTEDGDEYRPNEVEKPEIGDEFFFFNFKAESAMPSLIEDARQELLIKATEYLQKTKEEYVYDIDTRSIEVENKAIDLELGQRVKIISSTFGIIETRIQSYAKSIHNKYEAVYQAGRNPEYSRLSALEALSSENKHQLLSGAGITLAQAESLINLIGRRTYISKIYEDTAQGRIDFRDGATFSEKPFESGLIGGSGARIDKHGNAELESARIRSLLEVPEIRFNKISFVGDESIFTESAMIETVEFVSDRTYVIYPKLVDGEHIEFVPYDLLKGLFHDYENGYSGFQSSYLIVSEVNNDNFIVTLAEDSDVPTGSSLPPLASMRVSRVGNSDVKARQRYVVMSSIKGGLQIYDGASDFMSGVIIGSIDIAQDFKSKYPNIPVQEGLVYAYLQGLVVEDIIRVDKQNVPIRETHDRGKWKSGVTYYNSDEEGTDSVWHNGSKYRAFSNSTTSEPSPTNAAWTLITSAGEGIEDVIKDYLGDGDLKMEIDSSNGLVFVYKNDYTSTLTAHVLFYLKEITDRVESWKWSRQTGDDIDAMNNDALWNYANKDNNTNTMVITRDDIISGKAKFICDATVDNQIIRGII